MPNYFILNDVEPIPAASADDAAKQYAKQAGITGGAVLVSKGAKSFDITSIPPDIQVKPTPE